MAIVRLQGEIEKRNGMSQISKGIIRKKGK